MVFNEGSASLTFWSCGCWAFFLSTQPTLSGQDLVPLFYLRRDLILWAVPLPAAANNASPGLHLPVVKSTIRYLCPESLHCQEAGGRGAQVPPPPGSRIISPVSPNLTPFAVTPFGWAGKSRPQSCLGSVLCETRWGPQDSHGCDSRCCPTCPVHQGCTKHLALTSPVTSLHWGLRTWWLPLRSLDRESLCHLVSGHIWLLASYVRRAIV